MNNARLGLNAGGTSESEIVRNTEGSHLQAEVKQAMLRLPPMHHDERRVFQTSLETIISTMQREVHPHDLAREQPFEGTGDKNTTRRDYTGQWESLLRTNTKGHTSSKALACKPPLYPGGSINTTTVAFPVSSYFMPTTCEPEDHMLRD